jgi:hypothetical protein
MTERAGGEPWELPGAVRRDVEPDRSPTLLLLGTITLWCGLFSLVMGYPSLVAVPLGLYVRAAAGGDLKKMQQGTLDPRGKMQTQKAWNWAGIGTLLGLVGLAIQIVSFGLVFAKDVLKLW